MTCFVLNIHYKGSRGREVPKILKKIFFGVVSKMLFLSLDFEEPPPGHKHNAVPKGMVSSEAWSIVVKATERSEEWDPVMKSEACRPENSEYWRMRSVL